MTKFFLLPIAFAGIAAAAAPALAETVSPVSFSFRADGKDFDVTRQETPKGAILSGKDSSNQRFRLVVTGKHVDGFYGTGPVSFDIAAPIAPAQIALK